MPFACIFVPNFPVAAIFRAEPELRAQAVAIFEGKPPLEKVFAVNENASRVGISPGMTKAQAELCSELTLRPRSPLQESATHAALLDCAQSFSPCVEETAADTAILDLAGMESLFGTLPEIARNLFRCSADLGIDGNVAVASNPDAAVLAARGFSGVTLIPSGKEAECLGSLPVEVLSADQSGDQSKVSTPKKGKEKISTLKKNNEMLETIDRWGVRNLRALAALPEIALSERLGQEGLRLQQLARGAASRTLVPIEVPAVFEEAIELEFPIVLLEPLAFLLNRLLDQICARLCARALRTQELRLTLELQNLAGINPELETSGIPSESDEAANSQSPAQQFVSGRQNRFCRTLRLPLPMLDPKLFLKLLQLDLNAHPPGAPIMKIHLIAEPARPRSAQGGLFLPPSPEPEKLELTLARIAGLVGESRVGSVELLDTHSSESFRMRRFMAKTAPPDQLRKTSQPAEEEKSPVAALRMFRPSLRASVTLENGKPLRVNCSKKKEVHGSVLWKAGPWRSSGDWWERKAWARDEWDIALQNRDEVALYRLVHDLLGGGWFVEGSYD
jgi:protein ImuB